MPKGIPNPKPPVIDGDAELARLIAEDEAEKAKSDAALAAAKAEAYAEGLAAAKAEAEAELDAADARAVEQAEALAAAKAELEEIANGRPAEEIAAAMDILYEQAGMLGVKVDRHWSPETLAEKVIEAQEAKKAADKAAFDAAQKVCVYLLRGAFPTEDRKCFAGETIEVTPEIADKWYVAGVARPGRKPV